MTQTTDLQAVAETLRAHDRFLVVTHENPDGDALGSLVATTVALRQLGKDVEMFLSGSSAIPQEYSFMQLDGVLRELPADVAERVLVAVDCAKADRIGPDPAPVEQTKLVIDIDHHHDNTRFGAVNLIVSDASSTGEVLRDVFAELGVEITPEIAEPLYIALVTDTGRFQYTNTTPKSLRLAAELVEAVESLDAAEVVLLPNNKNVVLTAEQAVKPADVKAAERAPPSGTQIPRFSRSILRRIKNACRPEY